MESLSPLQTLPLHVAEKIVSYVATNIRFNSGYDNPNLYLECCHAVLLPLLGVCHIFRAAVFLRLSTRCRLLVSEKDAHEVPIPCASCPKRVHHASHLVAKEVEIWIDPSTACSGKALAALSCAPFNDILFPLARKLNMHFFDAVDDKEMLDASPDAKANVGAVVQRIRQMAPKVDFVKLSGFHGLQHRSTNHADELTAQLVQLGHRIELESGITGIHYYLKVDDFRDLTYLDCHSGLDGEQITQLVRQNAPTLQYLSILLKDGFDYSVIIKDDDGSYLEYPRLRTLVVKVDHNLRARPKRDFAGAAPFPILWRLVCSAVCPFGDDMILFRGNAASLEYLKLILTRELATTLIRHNVFTPTSYSKLHHVSLRLDINMALDNPADYPEIMQLIEGVAPDAAVREILSLPFGLLSTPVLPLFGKFANIQVLVLPGLRLSVWDAMTLFNSLPLLSDFHALSPTLDPLPEGVTKRKLVAHVLSSYSPMALRFRCWHLGTRQDELLKVSATPFVLLALACPNFDFVAVDPKRRDMLTRALEKTIGVATYKRYVPRLRRLLPHGLE